MNESPAGHVANGIIDCVRREWFAAKEEFRERYPFSDHGFSVFYSPVVFQPVLMVTGFNPAGTPKDFDESLRVPEVHDYFKADYRRTEYPLAYEMRRLFERVGKMAMLQGNMKVNLIPFRSRNKRQWLDLDGHLRMRLESFSRVTFLSILNTFSPRMVLVEGMETFDQLMAWVWEDESTAQTERPFIGSSGRRIYVRGSIGEIRVIGIPHLSWPVRKQDYPLISDHLAADLAD